MAAISAPPAVFPPATRPASDHLPSAVHHRRRYLNQLHGHILRVGPASVAPSLLSNLLSSLVLSSSLDHAFSAFLHLRPAVAVFPSVASILNRVFRDLSRSEHPEKALLFYSQARTAGFVPTRFSVTPLLKASVRVSWPGVGREIHGVVLKLGFEWDRFVQTGLVGAYAAYGCLEDARMLFEKMPQRDTVAWSAMMDGYSKAGLHENVLELYEDMRRNSVVEIDSVLIATVLSACGHSGCVKVGEELHKFMLESNIQRDAHLQSTLINMYAKCGKMNVAQQLFDELVAVNMVASTAMVGGYSRAGNIDAARNIFDRTPGKDLVMWSAIISGYAESEYPNEALKLFNEMRLSGIKPDQVTMLSVISACAHLGALDQAKWVHMYVKANNFNHALSVNNALIDMYSKCGSLAMAHQIFDNMRERNVISWTSMISGLAMHGDGMTALRLFEQMKAEKVKPNAVTFVGLLYGCSHAGLVDDGRRVFASMSSDHHILPKHEHYGCMVDLLGRANLLSEAAQLIKDMPFQVNVIIWGSLLNACKIHNNMELGEYAARKLLEVEPQHDGAYILLSNIFAKANKWSDVREVRGIMKKQGITKEKGSSWIEVEGELHKFLVGDKSHKKAHEIYEELDDIVAKLKLAGYAPKTCSVLVDMKEEEKKEAILLHSEKLAFAFGQLSVDKGSCIQIVKNLRICEDCHDFMKLASKVFGRNIVVRDRTRFHHYMDGVCSCNDYW